MQFKRLHPDAQLPTRQTTGAAGYDLHVIKDEKGGWDDGTFPGTNRKPEPVHYYLAPGERRKFRTGIAVSIPDGCDAKIEARSGLADDYGIIILAGEIDHDYRGEIKVILYNSDMKNPLKIYPGDRIAQLVVRRVVMEDSEWSEELSETARGANGFGHSGR